MFLAQIFVRILVVTGQIEPPHRMEAYLFFFLPFVCRLTSAMVHSPRDIGQGVLSTCFDTIDVFAFFISSAVDGTAIAGGVDSGGSGSHLFLLKASLPVPK